MKTKLQKLRKEVDTKYQEVCMGDGGLCQVCEIKPAYCCHHYIEKSLSNRLRYELKNGIKVCLGCHNRIHATSDPALFRKLDEIIGKKTINWLEKVRREPIKVNIDFYEENLKRLQKLCQKQNLQSQTIF